MLEEKYPFRYLYSNCPDVFWYEIVPLLPRKDKQNLALTNKDVRKRMQQIDFAELPNKSIKEKLSFLRQQLLALLGRSSQECLLDQENIVKGLLKKLTSGKSRSLTQASAIKELLQNFELWNAHILYHYARTILLAWQLKHRHFSTSRQRDRVSLELEMNLRALAYIDPPFYPYLFKNIHVFAQESQPPRAYVEEFLTIAFHDPRFFPASMAIRWMHYALSQKLAILEELYKSIMKRSLDPTTLEKFVAFVAPYHTFTENLSILRFFLKKQYLKNHLLL